MPRSPIHCTRCAAAEAPIIAVPDLAAYAGLFAIAFAAATLIPAQSEIALASLLVAGQQSVVLLLAVASLGNIAGSALNWGLGRGVARFRDRRWFPVSAQALARAEGWYRRWGRWSLLFSWAPVIGDPLTVAAGVLKEPFLPFLALVALAKVGRYLVVAAVALGLA
jgi:membrane protein YqaA with SNARE-associated domain